MLALIETSPAPAHESPDLSPSDLDDPIETRRDDTDLLTRLRAGDARAFAEVVARHTPHLAAVARRFLACDADVDDAVQDAFVAAFTHIDRFKGDARLSTWLHRITVNAALMSRRKTRRRREVPCGSLLSGEREQEDGALARAARTSTPRDAEDRARVRGEAARVLRQIRALPACHREVLELRHVQHQTTGQAARAMGITPGALKTKLHRAKATLLRSGR